MEVILIFLVIGIILYTLISGLNAIIITCKNCMAVGSTKGFFSDIFSGTGGNVFLILGILILCIPVYFILSARIKVKKHSALYRAETRYVANPNYRQAFEMIKTGQERGEDVDDLREKAIQYLVDRKENRDEAEESVSFYTVLIQLQKSNAEE